MAFITVVTGQTQVNNTSVVQWGYGLGNYLSLGMGLSVDGQTELYLTLFRLEKTVTANPGRVRLSLAPDQATSGILPGPEFSDRMKSQGTITFVASDDESLTIIGILDSTERYNWTPANSAEVSSFADHVGGLANTSVSITFDDRDAFDTPTVRGIDSNSIRVTHSEESDATSYDIRYREVGTNNWIPLNGVSVLSNDFVGLNANTEYEAQVRATTSFGISEWSQSGTGHTCGATLTLPRQNITNLDGHGLVVAGNYLYGYAEKSGFENLVSWNWPDRTRAVARDITVDPSISQIEGLAADGGRVYQSGSGSVYIYSLATSSARLPSGDFFLHEGNSDAHGMTIRDSVVHIVDDTALSIFDYSASGNYLNVRRALADTNISPGGVTLDAINFYVPDGNAVKVFTYSVTPSGAEEVYKVVPYDDLIYGITSRGQLRHTTDLEDWTGVAAIPPSETPVLDMIVFRDANGEPAIHVATLTGVWVFDNDNDRFLPSDIRFPRSDRNGVGWVVWRGDLYIPVGLAIYRYGGGANPVLSLVGPDRDEGVPWDGDSKIISLAGSHNNLLAAVENLEPTTPDPYGTSHILAYDVVGWKAIWSSGTNERLSHILTTTAYGQYGIWFSADNRMYRMTLPIDIINPSVLNRQRRYAGSGFAITPWFNASEADLDKVALRVKVECLNTSETQTITIDYGLNNEESWTLLATLTEEGLHDFQFPSREEPIGMIFRDIRFRITMTTSNSEQSPDLLALSLEYDKYLPPTWGFRFVVNAQNNYGTRTPDDMLTELRQAAERKQLMEFAYRGPDAIEKFYVEVEDAVEQAKTGSDRRGNFSVRVVEL